MAAEGKITHREPWNKGKIVGQKAPFKVNDIWALRVLPAMSGPRSTMREAVVRTGTPSDSCCSRVAGQCLG